MAETARSSEYNKIIVNTADLYLPDLRPGLGYTHRVGYDR